MRYKAARCRSAVTGFKARKRLGQNFLEDVCIRDAIIEAAGVTASDTVLEVGPGLGVLTEKLIEKAGRVIAVELDGNLALLLKKKLSNSQNLQIIHADILNVDLKEILGSVSSYKVVANIPYYITSPILHYFVHSRLRPGLMVIMMQKEVADEVASKAGHMNFLAVSMQLFSKPEIVCKVPASSFNPRPKVDSAVVKFNMLEKPAVPVDNIDRFLKLVHAGFAAPRKQLRNSLAIGLKLKFDEVVDLLARSHIDPQRRPGTLALEEWMELYRACEAADC